jgi:hypothetical protein
MSSPSPRIYLLHGNDEFAIQSFLKDQLIPKMGDSTDAAMDITTLDGRTDRLESVKGEAQTIPFLSKRRMVILDHPLALAKKSRDKFKEFLNAVPETTALVLIEGILTPPKKGVHWLLDWVQKNSEIGWNKNFSLPTGPAMWIMPGRSPKWTWVTWYRMCAREMYLKWLTPLASETEKRPCSCCADCWKTATHCHYSE